MKQNRLNSITVALTNAGLLKQVLDAPVQLPDSYEFGVDNATDARLIPGMLRTAYTAVGAAKLRLMNIEVPAFDLGADGEDVDSTTAQPEAPLSYEALQHYASAIYRVALSKGRHEDARWLLSMNRTYVEKDENGLDIARIGTIHVVVPFSGWLQRELEEADRESGWYAFLLLVKQQGADVPLWEDGVNAAEAVFNEWLALVPWTRDGDTRTHREKAVARSADAKWKQLIASATLGNDREVVKILGAWNLLVFSPKMSEDIAAIKASTSYKLMVAEEAVTAQEEQLALLEAMEYEADLKAKLEARQKALDERMAQLLGKQKPEAAKPSTVTPLPRPAVINSR